jgi:hypothetical protein
MNPTGFFSISCIVDSTGKRVSPEKAFKYGWVKEPNFNVDSAWGLEKGEIPLGQNLFVSGGRQAMLYSFAFRSPVTNYTLQRFGVGTGVSAPDMNDVQLENAVTLADGNTTKLLDECSFPAPFVVRVSATLGINDANGYLLTEFGIFSGDSTLCARFTRAGLQKTADWSPSIAYRLRC